jgi:hypothetical protein
VRRRPSPTIEGVGRGGGATMGRGVGPEGWAAQEEEKVKRWPEVAANHGGHVVARRVAL